MKHIQHLTEPTHVIQPVQSHIAPAIWDDTMVTACGRTAYYFRLPEFEPVCQHTFDHVVTALAATQDSVYVALDTRSQANSGYIVRLAIVDFAVMHYITIYQPAHMLRAEGAYLAVGMARFARLYLDFKQIAYVQLQRRVAGLELFSGSMLAFNGQEARIWHSGVEKTLDLGVTAASVFYNDWFVTARDNTVSRLSLAGDVVEQRFLNTHYYQMTVYGQAAICVGTDGRLFAFDLLLEQKGLVFDEICEIYINGAALGDLTYARVSNGFLYAQDSDATILAMPLRSANYSGRIIYLRSAQQVATSFGEILAIARLGEMLVFCAGSPYIFIARPGSVFADAMRMHEEPVTHVLERQGMIFSVSADSVVAWRIARPGDMPRFALEDPAGNAAENSAEADAQTLFCQTASVAAIFEFCRDTLVPACRIRLTERAYVTAFDAIVGKTRSTIALSVKNDIRTLEMHSFLNAEQFVDATPEFNVVTAHTDYVNALLFLNHELLVSGSADKSVALWDVYHVRNPYDVTPQQEETIYDIFTNKVDKRRRLVVQSDNSKVRRLQEIYNLSKRTIWHIERLGALLCVSCGDKKVRLLKLAGKTLSVVKTLEGFQFSVVKSLFLNETQVLSLYSQGIVTIVNSGTGETEYTQNMRLYAQSIADDVLIKNQLAGIEAAAQKVEFGTFALCGGEQEFLVGTSNGAILSVKDDSELVKLQAEAQQVQAIYNLQLFNDSLRENKYAEGIMIALEQRDTQLLFQAVSASLDAGCRGLQLGLDLERSYFVLETALKWLRLSKRYLAAVFLLDAVFRFAPVQYLVQAYGESCTLALREALRFLDKHRERVCEVRGQARVI